MNTPFDFRKYLGNRIWIVGSGSLDSYPRPGCHCFLCEIARKGGKDKRIAASSIFYHDVLFDLGPGVWKRVRNKEVKPKAVVLSHLHYDHIADLMKNTKISREVPIWASELHHPLLFKLDIKAHYFAPNSSFEPVKGFKIQTKIAVHTFTRPVSLLKFDKMIYAPDLGQLTTSDLAFAQGTKLWFGDGFSFDEGFEIQGERLHQSAKALLLKLKNIKSLEEVVLLGIGHHSRWPHEDYELLLKQFAMKENIPFLVELGWDNQILNPA